MKIKGIFPGTFDPITYGHMDIIERASKIVDLLIIGIAINPRKHPLFSATERKNMIEEQLGKNLHIKNIEVKIFDGLLAEFARSEGASVNIRGLRVSSDFSYEFQMSCVNKKLNTSLETIFLAAVEANQFISSSFVKEVAMLGGDISRFLPKELVDIVQRKINKLSK